MCPYDGKPQPDEQVLSATHTLHQVESFFREKILLSIGRKAHCLPKFSLCDLKEIECCNKV